ncbi:hypothetical protein ACIGCZ_38395 [Streptomyces nigra]
MGFDGALGDEEASRDFPVAQALSDEQRDLALPARQQVRAGR